MMQMGPEFAMEKKNGGKPAWSKACVASLITPT